MQLSRVELNGNLKAILCCIQEGMLIYCTYFMYFVIQFIYILLIIHVIFI